jgi:hypothetical protein
LRGFRPCISPEVSIGEALKNVRRQNRWSIREADAASQEMQTRDTEANVIFGSNGGVIREMDPESVEIVGHLTVTNAVAFTPDGSWIVPTYVNEIYGFQPS